LNFQSSRRDKPVAVVLPWRLKPSARHVFNSTQKWMLLCVCVCVCFHSHSWHCSTSHLINSFNEINTCTCAKRCSCTGRQRI